MSKTFSEINHEGAGYGWMWFSASEAATIAAREHGLALQKNKLAISAIVLAILDRLNERESLIFDNLKIK